MSIHLDREIESLKKKVIFLSTAVEESVWWSVKSLQERDIDLARTVIEGDYEIDCMEVEIEEDCLKILALHQPVAVDLRFIVAILKINSDLERIGDLAVNIAEQSAFLARQEKIDIPVDFHAMTEKTQAMLKKSLDALLNQNATLGREVCEADDEVDEMNRDMYRLVQEKLAENPERINVLVHILSVSRHLERIADHATNIAEDVIYMTEGRIIRHKTEDYFSQQDARKDNPS